MIVIHKITLAYRQCPVFQDVSMLSTQSKEPSFVQG
jgi:hypothetical protein